MSNSEGSDVHATRGPINSSCAAVTCQNADGGQKEQQMLFFNLQSSLITYHYVSHSTGELSFQDWMQKVSSTFYPI